MRAEIEPVTLPLESLLKTVTLKTLEHRILLFRVEGVDRPWPGFDAEALLTPEERARARGFAAASSACAARQSRALLRRILGALLKRAPADLPIRAGPRGKPYIPGGPLAFNLSHSGPLLLLGITRGTALGVDVEIERPRALLEGLIRRCYAREEQADFAGLDPLARQRRFHVGWTIKEAYLKAIGQGIALGLERVVLAPDQRQFQRLPVGPADGFQMESLARAGVHEAVVYRGPARPIDLWQGRPS